MPWKNAEDRKAAQKRYRSTPRGKQAAQAARDRFYAKRRTPATEGQPLQVDATELLRAWSIGVRNG